MAKGSSRVSAPTLISGGGGLDIGSHSNSVAERQGNIVSTCQTLPARHTEAWKTIMFLMKDIIRPKDPPLYYESCSDIASTQIVLLSNVFA